MRTLKRLVAGVGALSMVLGLAGPIGALAATSPSLGAAAPYGIISSTYTNSLNTGLETRIIGDVCYTTPPGTAPVSISGATVVPCPPAVGTAQSSALANLNAQPCTSLGAGAVDLNAIVIGANPPGTFPPGCYSSGGAMNVVLSTTVTLNGAGTYVFRPGGGLTTGANSNVVLTGGAQACDVFWTPNGDTTIGANAASTSTPTFVGNIITTSPADLYLGHFANLLGRLMGFGETVTTDSNTITVPTCAAPPSGGSSQTFYGSINVLKRVINDNGGTRVPADFPLFVNGTLVLSGETNSFVVPSAPYVVTEGNMSGYTQTFSGDCSATGVINLNTGDNMFCIITNDDIGAPIIVPPVPPLIDVIKVPSPQALPSGPGPVMYTYTLRNMGTVTVSNVSLIGDTCAPINRVSGDTDGDNMLDVSETWIHTCTTNLSATHTNNVVATGWANGLMATDIASATVVVGQPVVPPLIHVTKVPSPLTLPAGGGMVTYTKRVTNPGTVPLTNVLLTDDKCSPMSYVGGDTDGDVQLDPSETWTYTCRHNLTATTTNTAIASGMANGITVRDLAIVTVVVASAAPALPSTGFAQTDTVLLLSLLGVGAFMASILLYAIRSKRA